jgi:uncharacterized protein YabE (DUF348 family)
MTLCVSGIGWGVALGAAAAPDAGDATVPARYAPLWRASAPGDLPARAVVTVEIDGLRVAAVAPTGQTVADVLAGLGVALGPADRLSVDAAEPFVPGMRVTLDRGVPVTIVDGGVAQAVRAPRGTVADLLALRGVILGPLDTVNAPADSPLAPGAIVRISRVVEREVLETVSVPYEVRTVSDPALETGRAQVETPGAPGEVMRLWSVRYVDGVEVARALIGETAARAPVAEVRRVGVGVAVAVSVGPRPAEEDGAGNAHGRMRRQSSKAR